MEILLIGAILMIHAAMLALRYLGWKNWLRSIGWKACDVSSVLPGVALLLIAPILLIHLVERVVKRVRGGTG